MQISVEALFISIIELASFRHPTVEKRIISVNVHAEEEPISTASKFARVHLGPGKGFDSVCGRGRTAEEALVSVHSAQLDALLDAEPQRSSVLEHAKKMRELWQSRIELAATKEEVRAAREKLRDTAATGASEEERIQAGLQLAFGPGSPRATSDSEE